MTRQEKIQGLKNQIKCLKQEIDELNEQVKPMREEDCFYVDSVFDIVQTFYAENSYVDNKKIEVNNFFVNKKDCEGLALIIKTMAALYSYSLEHGLRNIQCATDEPHWYIAYGSVDGFRAVDYRHNRFLSIPFATRKLLKVQ